MIVQFRVKNFRSYWQWQDLSFFSSPDRTHEATHCIRSGIGAIPRVLRAAVIFGPNGGGKSNLLLALSSLQDLVLHSSFFGEQHLADRYTPFSFSDSNNGPIEFEIEILSGATRYRYSLSLNAHRILSERLLVYRTGKSQRWFERHFNPSTEQDEWAPFSPYFRGPREMWRKATRPTALFLTTAAQLNSELLQPVIHWFEHCLEFVFPSDAADLNRLAAEIGNPQLKARMLGVLKRAGLSVADLRLVEADSLACRKESASSVEFLHPHPTASAAWLAATAESAGTQRLLGILGPLLRAMEKGKLLVIDEFDASLHPLLARLLLQLLHSAAVKGVNAQLLLTSQNPSLLDLDILRRDEIWLVEPDANMASILKPLLRAGVRKHERIMRSYLTGRYGAVPRIRADAGTG